MKIAAVMLSALLLAACGKPAGSPCSITGSGFTSSHDCSTKCLSRWAVNCPDGSGVTPGVCAGREGCEPGSCPQGQACYAFDDPFEDRSYCLPDNVCGQTLSDADRQRWEQDSFTAAAAMRARYDRKRAQHSGAVTAPGEPPHSPTDITAEEPAP